MFSRCQTSNNIFVVLSLPQTQEQHRAGCCLPRGFGAISYFPLFQLLPPVLRIKLNISPNQETNFLRAGFQPNLGEVMECDGKFCSLCKVLGRIGWARLFAPLVSGSRTSRRFLQPEDIIEFVHLLSLHIYKARIFTGHSIRKQATFSPSFVTSSGSSCRMTSPGSKSLQQNYFKKISHPKKGQKKTKAVFTDLFIP